MSIVNVYESTTLSRLKPYLNLEGQITGKGRFRNKSFVTAFFLGDCLTHIWP